MNIFTVVKLSTMNTEFRKLPSVDALLAHEKVKQLSASYPQSFIVSLIRRQLESVRRDIQDGLKCPEIDEIAASLGELVYHQAEVRLRPVINATGVVLHTNLGRASLSTDTINAMDVVAGKNSNLEFDIESGGRGSRQTYIENMLCEVTGAEAGIVVNNNAAAVLLGLSAHAKRKEVIVSRGQAVEIGDSFRIPDVMRQSGTKLIEVGTTNCTYARDYENAVTGSTVAYLRVHSSNFRVVGFTSDVPIDEMVQSAEKQGLPVFDDLGSGCFLDTTVYGLEREPMVQQSIKAGAALVFFSGDKLFGGPQAGIIVGKRQYVDKLRRHPLARAVRIDKIRLAGLIATLRHYIKGEAAEKIPVWKMISMPLDAIEKRVMAWSKVAGGKAEVIDGESMVGGGSLPGGTLPTKLLAIGTGAKKTSRHIKELNDALRRQEVPVISRVQGNTLLLDPRTVMPEDDNVVVESLRSVLHT